jgi:hypothetical protein
MGVDRRGKRRTLVQRAQTIGLVGRIVKLKATMGFRVVAKVGHARHHHLSPPKLALANLV